MTPRDYYQVLGISRNASDDEITIAFRRLAREFHPDVTKDPQGEEKFKEVNEAYGVLSDTNKRILYNKFGPELKETIIQPSHAESDSNTRSGDLLGGLLGVLDINSLFGGPPKGIDAKGWFFAIPEADIQLLSAIYKLKVESQLGNNNQTYDTGVYLVSLKASGESCVKIRPQHWRIAPGEIRDGLYGSTHLVDPNKPINYEDIGFVWTNIRRPVSFDYYFKALDELAKKMAIGGEFDVTREHQAICNYGYNDEIIKRFNTCRVGYDEIYQVVQKMGERFEDVGIKKEGEHTTR